MNRPTVSQANMERLDAYPGDRFDDRLGNALLRARALESELTFTKNQLKDCDRCRFNWKKATIVCIGLIIYIGVKL